MSQNQGIENYDFQELLIDLYHRESGEILSMLIRNFGLAHLDTTEQIVQTSFLVAQDRLYAYGVSDYYRLWVWNNAKNMAAAVLKREKELIFKKYEIMVEKDGEWSAPKFFVIEKEKADKLKLFFALTHPSLTKPQSKFLILNLLFGFNVFEIKSALYINEHEIVAGIKDAKNSVSANDIPYELASVNDLDGHLERSMEILYELFEEAGLNLADNEKLYQYLAGNLTSVMESVINAYLTAKPHFNALLAYMLFKVSRRFAQVGDDGGLRTLSEQDRALWDKSLIASALNHLHKSADGRIVTKYHLIAGIEACHSVAESYDDTDWKKIVSLYRYYEKMNKTKLLSYEYVLALSKVKGAQEGIKEIKKAQGDNPGFWFYFTLGGLHMSVHEYDAAMEAYEKALERSVAPHLKKLVEKRMRICRDNGENLENYDRSSIF